MVVLTCFVLFFLLFVLFLYCFFYVYLFLFILSVLVEGVAVVVFVVVVVVITKHTVWKCNIFSALYRIKKFMKMVCNSNLKNY